MLPGTKQVFDGQLQGEEWILKLVRETPGQFPPGRHALSLHQPFPLLQQFRCHVVERFSQRPQFIARRHRHLRIPPSSGNFPRCLCQLLHRAGHASRGPSTEHDGQNNAHTSGEQRCRTDVLLQFQVRTAGVGYQQNSKQLFVLIGKGKYVDGFVVGTS